MATTEKNLRAFEGAQGFGAAADGGRGGRIVKVTNLDDSGPGSLRWALEDLDEPRIVMFEVGGTIHLKDQIEINGDVTVAGQTAPGGITVTGGRLRVVDSDVIIRGLHVRPGDGAGDDSLGNRDGISVGKRGEVVQDVIIDSNSITWSVDELASTWGAPSRVTFSNNIFAEALRDSVHPEGDHSMGLLVGDGSSKISIVGNLFAHNEYRNPTVKDDSQQVEFVNNVVYNYGPNGFMASEGVTSHLIGNLFIAGQDSASRAPIRLLSPESGTAYYLADNVGDVEGPGQSYVKDSYVFTPATRDVLPASQVFDHVLANAGARAPELDAIDARIIESVRDGTGSLIDAPDEVGGMLRSSGGTAPADRDDDGIPDQYEQVIGSDPAKSDAHGDADGDGYANIEDYINGLIDGFGKVVSPSPNVTDEQSPGDEPADDPADGSTPPASRISFEAEQLNLITGFQVDGNGHASGGKLIRATGDDLQKAELVFDGPSGTYDLIINYFDESDGVSDLSVLVNGKTVEQWEWDNELGSQNANQKTLTSHVVENVELGKGDAVVLAGYADRAEPLRIDSLEFVADLLLA